MGSGRRRKAGQERKRNSSGLAAVPRLMALCSAEAGRGKRRVFFLLEAAWSLFCQLIEVKKGSSKMMRYSTSPAFKQQKLEETRDKPRERKKTASQRVSKVTA